MMLLGIVIAIIAIAVVVKMALVVRDDPAPLFNWLAVEHEMRHPYELREE